MIRRAEPEDIPRIVAMGLRFARESEYRDSFSVVPQAIAETVAKVASSDDGVLFVSGSDGSLTGLIAVMAYPHPFTGERVAMEMAWWVEPEARGDGVRLLKEAEKWAKEVGASRMQMVAPNDRVGTLYERLGYSKLETTFQRSL